MCCLLQEGFLWQDSSLESWFDKDVNEWRKERAKEKEGEKGGMYKALSIITSNWTLSCVCAEYFQPANRFCFPCSPTCEGCTGPSSTDCLQCATGFAKEFSDDRSSWVLTVLNKQWKWYLLPYISVTVPCPLTLHTSFIPIFSCKGGRTRSHNSDKYLRSQQLYVWQLKSVKLATYKLNPRGAHESILTSQIASA